MMSDTSTNREIESRSSGESPHDGENKGVPGIAYQKSGHRQWMIVGAVAVVALIAIVAIVVWLRSEPGKRSAETANTERTEESPSEVKLSPEALKAAGIEIEGVRQRPAVALLKVTGTVEVLCEWSYPGNIRSLRNLVFELTSYVVDSEPITLELVLSACERLVQLPCKDFIGTAGERRDGTGMASIRSPQKRTSSNHESYLDSIWREGDIVLPIELCILRSGETFKQWTARAKRCSIEAARRSTGGTMQSVAQRLGLTRGILKSHLRRAKRMQKDTLFDE